MKQSLWHCTLSYNISSAWRVTVWNESLFLVLTPVTCMFLLLPVDHQVLKRQMSLSLTSSFGFPLWSVLTSLLCSSTTPPTPPETLVPSSSPHYFSQYSLKHSGHHWKLWLRPSFVKRPRRGRSLCSVPGGRSSAWMCSLFVAIWFGHRTGQEKGRARHDWFKRLSWSTWTHNKHGFRPV